MTGLFYFNQCLSTNDEIIPLLKTQPNRPIAVYTFHQTKGRGQYGNTWENSKDQNLAITLSCKKSEFDIPHYLFNYCTAIVLRNFLAILTDEPVFIKWPNDIIIKNKKVAGILIEKVKIIDQDYYIVGIGINVLQQNFGNITTAGSLFTQTQQTFELHAFTEKFWEYYNQNIHKVVKTQNIINTFNQHLFRKNAISVFEINGLRQNGIILKADKNGQLLIDLEQDGKSYFANQEVKLLY